MAVIRKNIKPNDEAIKLSDIVTGGGVVDEATLKRITDLEELVEKQATTITNQAIAINKQNELINTVDTDLNALVGGSDE